MWNVSAFGLFQLKSLKIPTLFQANEAKCMLHFKLGWSEKSYLKGRYILVWSFEMNIHPGSFSAVLLSMSDFFVQKYLAEYQHPSLTVTANSSLLGKQRK